MLAASREYRPLFSHTYTKKEAVTLRRIGHLLATLLPFGLVASLLLLCVHAVPADRWQIIGENTAIVAAALSSPRETVLYAKTLAEEQRDATAPTVPSSSAASKAPAAVSVIPPKGDGGGIVSEQRVGGGEQVASGITIKNKSGVSFDYSALLSAGSPVTLSDTDEPQVLIVHTHGSECYMSYYAGYYNDDDETRTTDMTRNVTAVGEVIAQELRAKGVGVIHDTTLHDSPAYSGAYTRSEETISSYLARYDSIRVVLDIHRDAMITEDLTKVKPTVTVDGNKAAQMMLVVGGTNTAELPNDHCEENLRLAMHLHKSMETAYEGIMRPIYLVNARYNQGLTAGSLLIEVGTDANTLSEALLSGRLVGKTLGDLLV